MNNLERLKQKMMIKPSVIQKQPVKILIGQETSSVPVIPQVSKTEVTFDEKPGFNRADIIKKLKRKTIDISAKKFDEDHKRGFWTYVKHVFKEFFRYNPMNISIDTNGQIKKLPVVLCTIPNTSEFGNGFKVSPNSINSKGRIG